MTYMRRHRGWWVLGAVLTAVAFVGAVAVTLILHRSDTPAADHEDNFEPVYFDDGTVFTPTAIPTGAKYLSADEAWMRWEHGHHLTSTTKSATGLLSGSGHMVWAYSMPGCMMPLGFPSARQVALASSPKCREWTFLDARTGRHIMTTDLYPADP